MYLLDSNVLIDASRRYYNPAIAPQFWNWIEQRHLAGELASVPQVRKEINDGDAGHLTTWAAGLPESFWLPPNRSTITAMGELSTWTMDPARPYRQAARDEFLRVADYFLVAEAHGNGHHVVTFEQPSPLSKKRVLIPDACIGAGVQYLDPFDMYRRLGLRL